MQLSDFLLEKLNSDVAISKRIQLAKNAFISSALRIPFKEENILLWVMESILENENKKENIELLEGFCFCIHSTVMTGMPASGIRNQAKSTISKNLAKILKKTEHLEINLIDPSFVILKKFFLHYKIHPKEYIKIFFAVLKHNVSDLQFATILTMTSEIFKSGPSHQKFMISVLKKNFHVLFENISTNEKLATLTQFLQRMLFRKELFLDILDTLDFVYLRSKTAVITELVKALIKSLHALFKSNSLDNSIKILAFTKIFESFAKSCSSRNERPMLQLFLLLCHIIGLEKKVQFKSHEGVTTVIETNYFYEVFGFSCCDSNEISYLIIRSLLDVLSSQSPDLNAELLNSTYLQWFQSLVSSTITNDKLTKAHLNFLIASSDLNTTILEKNFSKIFSYILSQPRETFENADFQYSYNNFMERMLSMYSKLQRITKFTLKLLQCIVNTRSELNLRHLISKDFLSEFSNLVTHLPSVQSLSLLDDLLKVLNENCVTVLEENSGEINTLLVQVTCALLSGYLKGTKMLSYTVPKGIVTSFIQKIKEIQEVLGRFGKAILARIHDREIVQPFLNISFYWGEFQLLIRYYIEEFTEMAMIKDISPTDFSTLHPYLNGEEWNVLAERISNFGAEQCYQLFLKLILQKLRMLHLEKCYSTIYAEATSKYVLCHLTSDLYKHNIIEELVPEDVNFLLSHLTRSQSRILLEKLYAPVFEWDEGEKLCEWIRDSVLLDNPNFVTLSFLILLQKMSIKLSSIIQSNGASDFSFHILCSDVVDENSEITKNNFNELTENVNKLLSGGNSLRIDNRTKLNQFKSCLDLIESFPLVQMTVECCATALSGITVLAVMFAYEEELLKRLLIMMYGLLMKVSRENPRACINLGLCIKWLLSVNDSKNIQMARSRMIQLLIRCGTNTETGLKELKQLIRQMKNKDNSNNCKLLKDQMLLYQDLGKSWVKNRKRQADNEIVSKYRKKLCKCIRGELEKQFELDRPTIDEEVLMKAYGIELTRIIKLGNDEKIADIIHLKFRKYLESAISKAGEGSCENGYFCFLSTVALHFPQLRKHVHKNTLKRVWQAMKTFSKIDWKVFYKGARDKDFVFFMLDLLKSWKAFAKGSSCMKLNTYFDIWKEFCTCEIDNKKSTYEIYLKRLFGQFSVSMTTLAKLRPEDYLQLVIFLRFCIGTKEVVMTSSMLDVSFDILNAFPYENTLTMKEFQAIFETSVQAASWLQTTRSARMKDKIQNIFLLFSRLLKTLVNRSRVTLHLKDEDLLALSSCSYNMEKWTSKMVKWNKDFARVTVYFIEDIVSSLVKATIYPAVKNPLVNCINNFLSISDTHSIKHLMRSLNPGSQQIFNGIYETYKKYYKFTGKV